MKELGVGLLLVAAAAVVAAPLGGSARARLHRLRPVVLPARAARSSLAARLRAHRIVFLAGAAGIAALVVVEGWLGLLAGVGTFVATRRLLLRLEPRAARAERLRAESDLPFAVELLSAALRAGAPVDGAVHAVATAMDGPLAARLDGVSGRLRLGSTPTEAWQPVRGIAGGERLVAVAVRSADSGAALASALTRLAGELRAAHLTRLEAAARRAGVLIVLPLGLCFLPAFVLAGLVPVVVSVLGEVL